MKIRINSDGKTVDIVNDLAGSKQVYGTVYRTFEKRKGRKETCILKYKDINGELEGVIDDVMFFARKYASSKDAMLRIDGDQYMEAIFDEIHPLRSIMYNLTNIYVSLENSTYINTITKNELYNLVESDISIQYAPMSNIIHQDNYAVYRIMSSSDSLIKLGCNRKRKLALPWLIIDEDSSDLEGLSITPPNGKLIYGMTIHDILSKTKNILLPYITKEITDDDFFNINVCGRSRGLINMNFGDFRERAERQIVLSGIEHIRSISVDIDFLLKIFKNDVRAYEKKIYAKIINEIIENAESVTLLPLWRYIMKWGEQAEPDIFKLRIKEDITIETSTIKLKETIDDYVG